MELPWQEDFDFYEAPTETGRAIIALDLGAAPHAPVTSHPIRVQFRVQMLRPRADGLRDAEEAPALFALEDRLVPLMRQQFDAIYVARVVAFGATEFYFYVPASHRDAAQKLRTVLGDTAPYQLEWMAEEDAAWERYEDIYPSPWDRQCMMNRRLQFQMAENGDQLHVPRTVDHLAFFPDAQKASEAAAALMGAGFSVDEPKPPAEGAAWAIEFHRTERCDADAPDTFVGEVFDLIEPHEGTYDGWGSMLQPAT